MSDQQQPGANWVPLRRAWYSFHPQLVSDRDNSIVEMQKFISNYMSNDGFKGFAVMTSDKNVKYFQIFGR